ncbi:Alpha/Beta hydrolase protein [Lipomyces arxii]|uniref:Alpha/Beta hydrolase protein n=1 Tax=Lipomyces arxii TaxID=56418 RepID=UPI0034CDE4F1
MVFRVALKVAGYGALTYLGFLVVLLFEPVQRNFLFLNKIKLGSKDTLYHPETVGFGHNQVAPFWLTTADGIKLLGWHVLPLDVYESHLNVLRSRPATDEAIDCGELGRGHLDILKEDPDARVIVYFHGNSGCISSIHRPDIYRALISTDPAHTHVFIVDYRGFGVSTGSPTENDLIADGAFVAKEILARTGVSASRTILMGQSLGTGVIIGAADLLARESPPTELRAIVPVAGFASIEELLTTYKIFDVVPILAIFEFSDTLVRFFAEKLVYKFHSDVRIERFVRSTKTSKVLIIHAFNDDTIPFAHGEKLLQFALTGAAEFDEDLSLDKLVDASEDRFEVVSVGREHAREYVFWQKFGNMTEPTVAEEEGSAARRIGMLALKWGGHNVVPKSTEVVLSIRRLLYED